MTIERGVIDWGMLHTMVVLRGVVTVLLGAHADRIYTVEMVD